MTAESSTKPSTPIMMETQPGSTWMDHRAVLSDAAWSKGGYSYDVRSEGGMGLAQMKMYRVTHHLETFVELTQVWYVAPSCLGSRYPLKRPTSQGSSSNLSQPNLQGVSGFPHLLT